MTQARAELSRLGSSFRDPSGFVFQRDGVIYRRIEEPYREDYRALRDSGLHDELVRDGFLVPAEEVPDPDGESSVAVLRPERIPFISYPYEWCFSQLKDATLLTLEIHRRALARGMALKDASAYNVQFRNGKPVLIDSLSFERYEEGAPWVAYRQFCRHFLAPIALASVVDARLLTLSRVNIDGVPLDLASQMLPGTTKIRPGLLAHIHMHAKSDRPSAGKGEGGSARLTKTGMMALIDSLKGTVEGLHWRPSGTEWADYYSETNYSDSAMQAKRDLVQSAIDSIEPKPRTCWDLGANTGEFSRLAAARGIDTIAWDVDPAAVEKAYLAVRASGEKRILPLFQDLTNPSPDLGWASHERDGLISRGPADVLLALALIHHLAIGNNVPLPMIAELFSRLGGFAIVEFVPKEDSQVQRMLAGRKDVFDGYSQEGWERAVEPYFEVLNRWPVSGALRTLYLLRRRR